MGITSDSLKERSCFNAVQFGQVRIEHDFLILQNSVGRASVSGRAERIFRSAMRFSGIVLAYLLGVTEDSPG